MSSLSRRAALKAAAGGAALLGIGAPHSKQALGEDAGKHRVGRLADTHDRVWLGSEFWANPMEDWRVVAGAAECGSPGGDRNIHLLTHQLTDADKEFRMAVRIRRVHAGNNEGGAGFRIGVRSELNEYRSNCFARSGIRAGLVGNQLVLGPAAERLDISPPDAFVLELSGSPAGERYALTLTAHSSDGGQLLGTLTTRVQPEAILGNVSLVNNFPATLRQGSRYAFADWAVEGEAFTVTEEHRFGPILWAMYSLSDSRGDEGFVLKLTALTGPLGERDNRRVELQIREGDDWKTTARAELDSDAWTATFRIPNWDARSEAPYRLRYREQHRDGGHHDWYRTGTIRANPADRPLRLGALTCQHGYGFPYEPVAENLIKLDPDLLYFSGDQLYESNGGYGVIREPAEPAVLNYLRKFYMFGWAFGEAMRDRPTLCIPDDHDVFQGNLWGGKGVEMPLGGNTSDRVGYIQPVRMLNVVHKTNTSHHPDFHDREPVLRGISVYHGELVYGGVGFAIVADRQFKSGPEQVDTGGGRADHVTDPDFDTSQLDREDLVLLGRRQEEFLKQWAGDWRGHTIKVLLSQTVFANIATHHGRYDGYLKADIDSGGWPQTARNRAIEIVRPAMPLHVNGDQHLASLTQYGTRRQRDGCWSFCTPAIAAGYPRWWRPDDLEMPHANRPRHGLPDTGEFLDGLGNKVYVYAIGNPEVGRLEHRYELAHQKGSGFGLVEIDPREKTYTVHAYRFLIDAADGNPENEFPGWPVTIRQRENAGENLLG